MAEYERPNILEGNTIKYKTPFGKMYITVNYESGEPVEIIARLGKSSHTMNAFVESIGRIASLALQSGVKPEQIAEQLRGSICDINCFHPETNELLTSIPDAIGKAILDHVERNERGQEESLRRVAVDSRERELSNCG